MMPLLILVNLDTTPAGVIRPIEWFGLSVNQRLPSGPAAIPDGTLILGSMKLDTAPASVIRPIELLPLLVNQRLPSGPAAIPRGPLIPAPAPGKLDTAPAGVIRPIE